jgi:hypothetical protein
VADFGGVGARPDHGDDCGALDYRRCTASCEKQKPCLIPGAGHVSNMEQPGVFNPHIRRFCLAA